MKIFPTLYARASTGKIKEWTISAEGAEIVTRHGYEGGAITTSRKTAKPKNVGRSNETTAQEQALREAEAKWEKQLDKGYMPDKSVVDVAPLRPMLAHPFEARKHTVVYPVLVQPKLDGVRCLATRTDKGIDLVSRNGKPIPTLPHIEKYLAEVLSPGDTLDGELFTPHLTFQEIISAVKRKGPGSGQIEYWVYDAVRDEMFEQRYRFIEGLFLHYPCVEVPTEWAHNEAAVMAHHEAHVHEGFEGAIVRRGSSFYKRGHRSVDLLKVKEFDDGEFEIIGGREGEGKDEGTVIFRCVCADGEFDARPRGTHERRSKWFRDLDKLVGSSLTVRHFGWTDADLPRFPVGLAVRDYE